METQLYICYSYVKYFWLHTEHSVPLLVDFKVGVDLSAVDLAFDQNSLSVPQVTKKHIQSHNALNNFTANT